MTTQAVDALAAVTLVFIGLPAGWTLIWAFARFVNHRYPRRGF